MLVNIKSQGTLGQKIPRIHFLRDHDDDNDDDDE